jgi:hypothetical protein
MTIEEIIAIAKTLRPGFLRTVEYYTSEHELIDVALIYGIEDPFRGKTYLDALHAAGWKG